MRLAMALAVFLIAISLESWGIEDLRKEQQHGIGSMHEGLRQARDSIDREFQEYAASSRDEFLQYVRDQEIRFERFRLDIESRWGKFHYPSNTLWIEYGYDKKTVGVVDFDEGVVTVEVLAEVGEDTLIVENRLAEAIERIVTSKGSASVEPQEGISEEVVLEVPLLKDQVMGDNGEMIDSSEVALFAQQLASQAFDSGQKTGAKDSSYVIGVSFKLVPDHIRRRAKPYVETVIKQSKRYNLDPAHVMATIHVESMFNPMARSSSNALGLMQLVPHSGAREAYQFVHGFDKTPNGQILFDPEQNIELGCAYIHLLKTRYFGTVKNRRSMLYCAIAGYNTGPGNVAVAFLGVKSVTKAVDVINTYTDDNVLYDYLLVNLPYKETRNYLFNVVKLLHTYSFVE